MTNIFENMDFTALGLEKEIKSHEDINFSGYVSEGLAKYVFNLYQRHELDVNKLNGMPYAEVRAEVDRLSAMPFPPSPKQKETIYSLIEELKQLNPQFDVPVNVIQSLTGGQDGTAGQFIGFLYQQRTEMSKNAPLTDAQAERILQWIYCPDIDFAEYGIQLKMPYPTDLNPNAWKFVTPEEFIAQLKEKFTREFASEFIGKYKDVYYDWKRTRINDNQIKTIRALEDRMAGISKIGVKTFAVVDGVVQEVYQKPSRDWNPKAYEPMSDLHLSQMSKEDASAFIRQLESEVSFREKSAIETTTGQEDLEKKRSKLSATAKEVNKATSEYRALVDLAFALEAVAGQENEELHESITELMVHRTGSPITVAGNLTDFMEYLLQRNFISFKNLVELCENSNIATQILQLTHPKQYDEAVNGKGGEAKTKAVAKEATKKADTTVQDFMAQFNK